MDEERTEEMGYHLEGIAFGLADGIICCLGLIIGFAEATNDTYMVIVAGVIGGIANAFGNSIGFYMSQSAERGLQIHGIEEYRVQTRVHSKREIVLNSFLAFAFSIIAVLALLLPFAFLDMAHSTTLTFLLGTLLSFSLGGYVGKISREGQFKTGLKYALLAVAGAAISHLMGDVLKALLS